MGKGGLKQARMACRGQGEHGHEASASMIGGEQALVRQHGLEGVTRRIFKADHKAERGAGSIAVGALDPGGEPSQTEGPIGWVVARSFLEVDGRHVRTGYEHQVVVLRPSDGRQGGTWAEIGQDAIQVRANFRGGLADRQGWGGARGWSEDEARPRGDFRSGSKGGGAGRGFGGAFDRSLGLRRGGRFGCGKFGGGEAGQRVAGQGVGQEPALLGEAGAQCMGDALGECGSGGDEEVVEDLSRVLRISDVGRDVVVKFGDCSDEGVAVVLHRGGSTGGPNSRGFKKSRDGGGRWKSHGLNGIPAEVAPYVCLSGTADDPAKPTQEHAIEYVRVSAFLLANWNGEIIYFWAPWAFMGTFIFLEYYLPLDRPVAHVNFRMLAAT
ncbi:hypothetical protein EDB83DRAFT_2317336 [Lactarius deliciosus]|nr:hypothetical protein EDB83DRAFT_2317336 [Lactarius deliciosus]